MDGRFVTKDAQRLVRVAALEQVEVEQINTIGDGHQVGPLVEANPTP